MDPRILNPLIHIGYQKTGSSWLREHIFNRPDRGFSRFATPEDHINRGVAPGKRFAQKFFRNPDGELYAIGEFSPAKMREMLAQCELTDSGVPLLSWERLAGHPDTGGFLSKVMCERLALVFDSPKIFLAIREQKALIAAYYIDYLLMGGTLSLDDYIDPSCTNSPRFRKRFFLFHNLISMYQDTFGKENVLVLPYEMFCDEPTRYLKILASFSGADIPDSLPVKSKVNFRANTFFESKLRYMNLFSKRCSPYEYYPLYMGKFVEKLVRSLKRRLSEIMPDSVETNERARLKFAINEMIGERFKESNLKTSELIGIDLSKYNY